MSGVTRYACPRIYLYYIIYIYIRYGPQHAQRLSPAQSLPAAATLLKIKRQRPFTVKDVVMGVKAANLGSVSFFISFPVKAWPAALRAQSWLSGQVYQEKKKKDKERCQWMAVERWATLNHFVIHSLSQPFFERLTRITLNTVGPLFLFFSFLCAVHSVRALAR